LLKGYLTLKKHLVLLAAIFCFAFPTARLSAQQEATKNIPRFSENGPAERILNLDDLKDELKKYNACTCKCGCYSQDIDHQAAEAIVFLRARAAHRRQGEKLALVLDIDETTLTNYEQMLKADFGYDKAANDAWIESAKAPAIPGTLRIFQEAKRLGVSVFFLTGRLEAQRAATELNLHNVGFTDWQRLILRSPAEASATAQAYKSAARGTIQDEGFKIVLNVGDQWSDLRGKPEAEFSVKYPDPYYFLK